MLRRWDERLVGQVARSQPVAYRQLADGLRARLREGEWGDGRALPTEFELAGEHGVSRQTVRRAMQELVAEGAIYRIPGRGTFAVAANGSYLRQFGSVDDLMGLSHDTELEIIRPLRSVDDADAAIRLGLSDSTVGAVCFSRRHDDEVFCVTTVFLPPSVADLVSGVHELAEPGRRSTVTVLGLLDSRLATPIAEAQQTIDATVADHDLQARLNVDDGDPLLRIDRLYRDAAGAAVELAVSHFTPRHYAYRVTLRRHPY